MTITKVKTNGIDDLAITTAKLADSSVNTVKLTNASVSTAKLQGSAVTTEKLGAASVTTEKVVDEAVTWTKLASAAIASVGEIVSGAASKLVSAANLKSWFDASVKPVLPIATGYIQGGVLVSQTGGLSMTYTSGGTGLHTITFGTALADTNYYIIATASQGEVWPSGSARLIGVGERINPVKTASAFTLTTWQVSSGAGIGSNVGSIAFAIYKY